MAAILNFSKTLKKLLAHLHIVGNVIVKFEKNRLKVLRNDGLPLTLIITRKCCSETNTKAPLHYRSTTI